MANDADQERQEFVIGGYTVGRATLMRSSFVTLRGRSPSLCLGFATPSRTNTRGISEAISRSRNQRMAVRESPRGQKRPMGTRTHRRDDGGMPVHAMPNAA